MKRQNRHLRHAPSEQKPDAGAPAAPVPRPRSGLEPEEALARWSDPQAYQAMREYWDARQPVSAANPANPTPRVLRYMEYARRRKPLEAALHRKLASGELAASVLPVFRTAQATRQVVHPATCHDAEIDWEFDEIVGLNLRLEETEIFDPRSVPLNVWDLPSWFPEAFGLLAGHGAAGAAPRTPGFRHSANYRQVPLGNVEFALSVAQSRVVRALHEALRNDDPWMSGRDLLAAANSESEKLAQLFRRLQPHWSLLIESDRKGMYRLLRL